MSLRRLNARLTLRTCVLVLGGARLSARSRRTPLTTAYAAGLRASETVGLKVAAVDSGGW